MEIIFPTIGIIVLICIFAFIGYHSSRYNSQCDILDEQFNADVNHTRYLMSLCTKKDAAKLIDKFYERWNGLIPEWVICAHVMQLRRYLDSEHQDNKITFPSISKN